MKAIIFEDHFLPTGLTASIVCRKPMDPRTLVIFTTSVSLGKGRGQHAAIKRKVKVKVAMGQCLEI